MDVLVTGGLADSGNTLVSHTEESVLVGSGAHSVDSDLDTTIRAVLEACQSTGSHKPLS